MSSGRPKRKSIKYAESSDEEPELKKPKVKPVKRIVKKIQSSDDEPELKKAKVKPVKKTVKKVQSSDDEPELKKTKVKPVKRAVKKVHCSDDEPDSEKPKVTAVKKSDKTKSKDLSSTENKWEPYQLLSEIEEIPPNLSKTIIQLFEDEHTIPFIARYRKDLICDLTPDKLRDIKISYDLIQLIETKADTIVKNLKKDNLLNDDIEFNIRSARSIVELDDIWSAFKPASKGSLFERAKSLGLELIGESFLSGDREINLKDLVKKNTEGLETEQSVRDGVKNIISHLLTRNGPLLEEIRRLRTLYPPIMSVSQIKSKPETDNTKVKSGTKKVDEYKFETYFNFSSPTNRMKPHQILAINRGESLKVLNVKMQVDNRLSGQLKYFATNLFMKTGVDYSLRHKIFYEAFEDTFTKKITPLIVRQTRADLLKIAEKSSVNVFASNLKQLLLTAPVKGEKILSIDPGFTNGCKLALISENSEVLETGVIYPHTQSSKSRDAGSYIGNIMRKNKCSLIAIGNGTACRETEVFITDLLNQNILDKSQVRYVIVSEQGASIYSCGDIAKKEFPKLDVNIISAISIARRLQDPLCELVKIDPKCIGVGMYQHDINDKVLSKTLDEVVVECVSFVGIDINTASQSLLARVAGMTEKRAEAIIKHRLENGSFKSRDELKKVKGIGPKTFVQCAGFIRINNLTAGIEKYNKLDATNIHPESYKIVEKIMKQCGLVNKQIGTPEFIKKIKEFSKSNSLEKLAETYKEPAERVQELLNELQKELAADYRLEVDNKPLFKQGLTKITDLKEKSIVTGAVTNIVEFGAFLDIGVHRDGLIHKSNMCNQSLKIGDKVECFVMSVDVAKGRIGLRFNKFI